LPHLDNSHISHPSQVVQEGVRLRLLAVEMVEAQAHLRSVPTRALLTPTLLVLGIMGGGMGVRHLLIRRRLLGEWSWKGVGVDMLVEVGVDDR
jgi:hypothetical protein